MEAGVSGVETISRGVEVVDFGHAVPSLGRSESLAEIRALRRNVHGTLEAWIGRASICWLIAYVPLLLTGRPGAAVLPAVAIWLLAVAIGEETSPERRPAFGATARIVWLVLAGFAALSALHVWVPGATPARDALAVSALALAVAGTLWEQRVRRAQVRVRGVLVVGATQSARELIAALREARTPYAVLGVVDDELSGAIDATPTLGTIDDLAAIVRRHRPDVVVIACERNRLRVFSGLLEGAGSGFAVAGLPEFYEHVFGRVPVRSLSAAWFMSALHLYQHPYSTASKRLFDVTVALVGLVLTAPLMAAVALLVRLTGRPVIYRQRREGSGGTSFTMYKFRTMVVAAEAAGKPQWAGERDPRITAVGRVLRKTRLDELPQFWNVLRGEMSIVGPRPERPEYFDVLSESVPFWSRRTLVKPGITGWAQVNDGYAADTESTERKLSYDLWYLRHRSLLVDVAICARTFARLGAGAR